MTRLQILKNVVTLAAYDSKKENVTAKIAKLFRSTDTVSVLNRYERIAEEYSCKKSKYLQMMAPGKKRGRNILISADYFTNVKEVTFEDTTALAPAGYDAALRGIYGDYMELPPEEARKPHHDFTLWVEE